MATIDNQPYRGSRDFYPQQQRRQDYIFGKWSKVVERYGFEPYQSPLIEPLEIYQQKNQSNQEIIDRQIYNFVDRGGRQVAIRPEMTASLARMIVAKQGELPRHLRWYSLGRFWRYEKPQKGRFREHWQLNADIFGIDDSVAAEAEIVLLVSDLFREFKAPVDSYQIQISNRQLIEDIIVDYIGLDRDLFPGVCRVVDLRLKIDQDQFRLKLKQQQLSSQQIDQLIKVLEAESVDQLPAEILDKKSAQDLVDLFKILEDRRLNLKLNLNIVRGFDYYTGFVFEVFDTNPANSRSLLAGGRYDNLIESFGGQPQPGVGFGFGDAVLSSFLDDYGLWPQFRSLPQVAVALVGINYSQAWSILNPIRQAGLNVFVDLTERQLIKKINQAKRKEIPYFIVLGKQELESTKLKVKQLQDGSEIDLTCQDLISKIINNNVK